MYLKMKLDKDFEIALEKARDSFGEEFMKIEGLSLEDLDPMKAYEKFTKSINIADASIDDNANVNDRNVNTIGQEIFKPLKKLKAFNNIYSKMKDLFGKESADEWVNLQIGGATYFHDFSADADTKPYCFAFSLKDIVNRGLFFIREMKAKPAKHLSTYNNHVLEFVSYACNQQSGAVGLPDYLLYSYYFWKKDIDSGYVKDPEGYKKQEFQTIIFNLNQPYLKTNQSAYTNFTIIDREYFVALFGAGEFPDGSFMIDCMEAFMEYQKDFLDFIRKERETKSFTFPVLTASLIFDKDKGEYKDNETFEFIVKHNMKWEDVNLYNATNPDALSSCCRLVSDLKEIDKHKKLKGNFNSIGGTDLNVGSLKVNTINLPRVGYLAKGDFDKAKELIKEFVENSHKVLKAHRELIQEEIDRGLLPLYSHGLMRMERQFSTVGVTGIMEYIESMGGIDRGPFGVSYNEKGLEIASKTLDYINELNKVTDEKYDYTTNMEQIPGESATIKLAYKDSLLFPDLVKTNIYSNQWIALNEQADLVDRIKVCSELDVKCGGGQIFHINLGEDFKDLDQAISFNKNLARNGIIYFSNIRKFNYCKNDHNFFGNTCPICGEEPKGQIIKVVGYLVKNEYYKKDRRDELESRVFYNNV